MKKSYLTAPVPSEKIPPGIPYILANETAERFAFYGVKLILTVFLSKYLLDMAGGKANLTDNQIIFWGSVFSFSAYFLPLIGAALSDAYLGKFRTIIIFSAIYCFGFLALVLNQSFAGTFIGLTLIAIGTGVIKPCVSANVGDQFGKSNQHLISKAYGWFYSSINLGAFVTSITAPLLLDRFGPRVAFAVPGVFMLIALFSYWFGRGKFVHRPPAGVDFVRQAFNGEGLRVLGRLSIVFLFVSVFWSLFDQTMTAWVLQAENMNREIVIGQLKFTVLSSQIQAANPALVIVMIPLFTYLIYPALNKVFALTSLKKICIGFFVAAGSFAVSVWIESQIDRGFAPHIIWQIVAYVFMTAAEIMVSVTVLEFAYTQSPPKMKSLLQSISLLPIAFGNALTALVNIYIQNPDGTSKLPGADYYWFFTAVMAGTAVLFIFVVAFYKEKTYITEDAAPVDSA